MNLDKIVECSGLYNSGFGLFKVLIEELAEECRTSQRPVPLAELLALRAQLDEVSDHLTQMFRHDCFDEDSYAKLVMSVEEYQVNADEVWTAYGNRPGMAVKTSKKLCSGLTAAGNIIVENTQKAFVVHSTGGPEAIQTGHTKAEVEKKQDELLGGG